MRSHSFALSPFVSPSAQLPSTPPHSDERLIHHTATHPIISNMSDSLSSSSSSSSSPFLTSGVWRRVCFLICPHCSFVEFPFCSAHQQLYNRVSYVVDDGERRLVIGCSCCGDSTESTPPFNSLCRGCQSTRSRADAVLIEERQIEEAADAIMHHQIAALVETAIIHCKTCGAVEFPTTHRTEEIRKRNKAKEERRNKKKKEEEEKNNQISSSSSSSSSSASSSSASSASVAASSTVAQSSPSSSSSSTSSSELTLIHVVNKRPKSGGFLVQSGARSLVHPVHPDLERQARAIFATTPFPQERFLYARIDCIRATPGAANDTDEDGNRIATDAAASAAAPCSSLLLMEFECIEPDLYAELSEGFHEKYVAALQHWMERQQQTSASHTQQHSTEEITQRQAVKDTTTEKNATLAAPESHTHTHSSNSQQSHAHDSALNEATTLLASSSSSSTDSSATETVATAAPSAAAPSNSNSQRRKNKSGGKKNHTAPSA